MIERLENRRLLSAYTFTTLAGFGVDPADPHRPSGPLAIDREGNLYGATNFGGVNEGGTVFEFSHGTITTLARFTTSTGYFPEGGLVIDADGNLFGTTYFGGSHGNGTVFEVVSGSGTITPLFNIPGGPTNTNGGVALDAQGNVYGTYDIYGVPSSEQVVFELSKSTGAMQVLATIPYTPGASGELPGSVVLDGNGNVYGMAGHTVYEVSNGTLSPLATLGQKYGYRVIIDGNGNVYGTARSSTDTTSTIFEIPRGGGTTITLGTVPDPWSGVDIVDGNGNLFGTSIGGPGTVFEISHGVLKDLVLFNGTDGSGPQGSFEPGLTLDENGNIFGTTLAGGQNTYVAPDGSTQGTGTIFEIAPARVGDANLDGKVDFSDLLILAQNYGRTNADWTQGDFDADSTVDFNDLLVLAQNYGTSRTKQPLVRAPKC